MSSDELDISAALNNKTPEKKSRKRKTSKEESESPEKNEFPSVFGAIGTPMAKIENEKEWDEWKEKELEKVRKQWKRYLRSKWDLEKDKLPKKSESPHLLGRHEHMANVKRAQAEVAESLEAIREMHFNVGKGKAINIQVNGQDVPKKKTKKFAAAVEQESDSFYDKQIFAHGADLTASAMKSEIPEKALKEMGNPTIEEMMTDDMDEEERRAEAEWERQRAAQKRRERIEDAEIMEAEEDDEFFPWHEYCDEMEEQGKSDKIGENNYKKWLEKKMEENKVSYKFNRYQMDLICLDKDAFNNRHSLKSVVKGVQNFYRKMRGSKKDK